MPRARIVINPQYQVAPVHRRVFGSFVEHLGRAVYDGIYEPGHPTADEDGFRRDVIELVRELGVSTIRYPGGNFVSGFLWEDSVGPKGDRPVRLDLAWHSKETNQVGLHEFADWLEKVGSELMLAVNLGTRGTKEALELLEYANQAGRSTLADRRAANGRPEPLGVAMWCLGNEMDGPWQLGQRSPEDYGRIASQTAKAMRQLDPSVELVACGSSGASMPTFGEWERTVLQHAYDDVDYISCHAYYEEKNGDLDSFLASSIDMDSFISTVVATADYVRAEKRSEKRVNISFDEWNVWYISRYRDVDKIEGIDNWPIAPRLLEDVYSVADAVVFGSLMITLLRHADRVTSASLAQLVNVIAPVMTEPGGPAWRQTTFFPFAITSRLARGVVLETRVQADRYQTAQYGSVPVADSVVTHDPETGDAAAFLVNRSRTETVVEIEAASLGMSGITEAVSLWDADVYAQNTLADPERVTPRPNSSAALGDGMLTVTLPPVSWTAIGLR